LHKYGEGASPAKNNKIFDALEGGWGRTADEGVFFMHYEVSNQYDRFSNETCVPQHSMD
jgi:hypothetical protein